MSEAQFSLNCTSVVATLYVKTRTQALPFKLWKYTHKRTYTHIHTHTLHSKQWELCTSPWVLSEDGRVRREQSKTNRNCFWIIMTVFLRLGEHILGAIGAAGSMVINRHTLNTSFSVTVHMLLWDCLSISILPLHEKWKSWNGATITGRIWLGGLERYAYFLIVAGSHP